MSRDGRRIAARHMARPGELGALYGGGGLILLRAGHATWGLTRSQALELARELEIAARQTDRGY